MDTPPRLRHSRVETITHYGHGDSIKVLLKNEVKF